VNGNRSHICIFAQIKNMWVKGYLASNKEAWLHTGCSFFCCFDFGDRFCFRYMCSGGIGSKNGRTLGAKGKM
jgi:hypothetical protein